MHAGLSPMLYNVGTHLLSNSMNYVLLYVVIECKHPILVTIVMYYPTTSDIFSADWVYA